MILLPYLDTENKLCDGVYIKALSFCKKNYHNGKCQLFYKEVIDKEDGFYKCPYGLSVCVKCINNEKFVFTSFRENETYMRKNKKFLYETEYNPVLSKEQINTLINNSINEEISNKKIEKKQSSIDSMFHEVSKLNAQMKEHCETLFSNYAEKTDLYQLSPEEYTKLFDKIKTLYVMSTIISTRYSLYSYERNPEVLTSGYPIDINIYKKFDKCRRVLKNYQKKNVPINFEGQSYKGIKAYPSFEMIPFLLLENALKYSVVDAEVKVNFSSSNDNYLTIKIESYGPYCNQSEITHITEKGYRGKNAQKKSDGNGIGLYFAKTLCDIHHIRLSFVSDSQNQKEPNGIMYAPFIATLQFVGVFDMNENE